MTKLNFVFIAVCLTVGLSLGGEVQAQPTKNVNVVNEPNVSVLNNVDVNVTNDMENPVPVVVQNGTSTPPVKELVEIVELGYANRSPTPSTPIPVYTVPAGKRLVITDVIIRSGFGGSHSIFRDGTVVSSVATRGGIYNHSYVSGIEFQENQIVSIQAPRHSCTSGCSDTDWELRGYQTDIN